MSIEFPHPFELLQKDFRKMMAKMPRKIAEVAITEFDENFNRQGFKDEGITPWQPLKRMPRGGKRTILIKSGRLRRSWRNKSNSLEAVVQNYAPYAQIHNEGGEISNKGGTRTLSFREFKRGKNAGRILFSKAKRANFEQEVNIPAYKIKMPKRQFMGYSKSLERQILSLIDHELDKLLTWMQEPFFTQA